MGCLAQTLAAACIELVGLATVQAAVPVAAFPTALVAVGLQAVLAVARAMQVVAPAHMNY